MTILTTKNVEKDRDEVFCLQFKLHLIQAAPRYLHVNDHDLYLYLVLVFHTASTSQKVEIGLLFGGNLYF